MRPSDVPGDRLFECFGCGYRTSDTDSRSCPDCGERLQNIGTPRDR